MSKENPLTIGTAVNIPGWKPFIKPIAASKGIIKSAVDKKWYESNYVIYGGIALVLVVVLFFAFKNKRK